METNVIEFNIEEAAIAKMKDLYMALTVKGVDDEQGFKECDDARKIVKSHRVSVEKRRKELKSDALSYGRRVDKRAKELMSPLLTIEDHLKTECNIVLDEKKRIKEAEEKAFQEKIDNRMAELAKYGRHIAYQEVAIMDDDEWSECIFNIIQEYNAEQEKLAEQKRLEDERLAKEAEERKAEEKRLEQIRIEQERVAAEMEEELAKKQAEIEAKERAIAEEKERIEAEKRARIENKWRTRLEFLYEVGWNGQTAFDQDTEETIFTYEDMINLSDSDFYKIADAHNLKVENRNKEKMKAEFKRREALKPDIQKAIEYIELFREMGPPFPEIQNEEIRNILLDLNGKMVEVFNDCHMMLEQL